MVETSLYNSNPKPFRMRHWKSHYSSCCDYLINFKKNYYHY